MNYVFIALALSSMSSFSVSAWAACPARANGEQCRRFESVVNRWGSAELKDIAASVEESLPAADSAGPCLYNEETSRIEMTPGAFKLSDSAFVECLSRAFAQARYDVIEESWLEHLGVTEAWIVNNGELVRATLPSPRNGQVVELSRSRSVWTSLAAAELDRQAAAHDTTGRALASGGEKDDAVRELLGLK